MERRLLQFLIGAIACVPVYGGLYGLVGGLPRFGADSSPAAESQFRYLSGLLLGVGLLFWRCVPGIEKRGGLIRPLTALVLVGGFARLYGLFVAGDPGPLRWTLYIELGVTPAICIWQARVASNSKLSECEKYPHA